MWFRSNDVCDIGGRILYNAGMEEFDFTGYKSIRLHGRHWASEKPEAVILIVHGFGEHCGRYAGMAEYYLSRGFSVLSYDHRGHGLSEGKRGLLLSWSEFREDLHAAENEAVKRYPAVPLFILGHSLGGTMVLDYLISSDNHPRGAIISAPALGTPGISHFLLTAAKILSVIAPGLTLSTGLDSDSISRDPEECRKYREDTLVHDKASMKMGSELTAVQKRIFESAGSLNCPLLICYGSQDTIAPHEPIELIFEKAGSADKELKIFENAFHEMHNDTIRDEVYRVYADWISARI
jgi:alpha-beta hydrolase superfamily lysophospholipase